jgi:valyl-tRNA synthetase
MTATLLMLCQGVIDAQAELNKAEKKRTFAESARDKLVKQRSAPDYATKRPVDVQNKEADKVKEWEAEIDALTKAMENFKTLM